MTLAIMKKPIVAVGKCIYNSLTYIHITYTFRNDNLSSIYQKIIAIFSIIIKTNVQYQNTINNRLQASKINAHGSVKI